MGHWRNRRLIYVALLLLCAVAALAAGAAPGAVSFVLIAAVFELIDCLPGTVSASRRQPGR